MLLTFDCMHIDSAATATQAHLRLHATVPSATSARAASAVCTASVGLGRQLIRTRKRRNTNGECVARAPLHTPTADQHTRAAPNRYVRPVGEHWPWCVCVPCTAMSHASTRWYSLLVPSDTEVALRHRSTRDRLSDSSLLAPLYIRLASSLAMDCASHTPTLLLTALASAWEAFCTPR